jgi:Flp pilus assembly protein TadD
MHKSWLVVVFLAVGSLLAVPPVCAQQGDGPKIALLVGNSNYPDADAPLRQPSADARALADELKRNGFDVDVAENLTKEGMQRALERLYGKIKSGSAALIFFSGYGIQTGRQTYLIPVNAQIWTEAEVRRDGVGIDTILAEMNARGASVKLAVLDASRRNPFERRFRGVSTGLAPITAPRGTLVISAAAPGTVVNDSEGDNSIFVRELLKEMRSPSLTAEEIFNRTRIGVSRVSKNEQVPWISSSLVEDFYFGKAVRPADAGTPPPSRVDTSPPAQQTDDDSVRRDYDFAERLGTRRAWEDFLAKHKSGPYADRARDKLAMLEPARQEPPRKEPPREEPPRTKAKTEPQEASKEPLIRELDRAIRDNPDDADAYFKRGLAYAQNGNYNQAIQDFGQAIRLNPKDPEAFNNRCWARAMIGDLQIALRDCNESLRLRPNFVDALDSRGLVNLKIGLPNSAISDYNAALRLNPKHASALFGRGKAKIRNGDRSGGNADIDAAKAINPEIDREFEGYGIK